MKKSILQISVLAMLAILSSCSSDDKDTEKPTVQIITPSDESDYAEGDNINITFVLTDNEALKSFKIDIHENDGHNHGPRPAENVENPFSYELIENINGNLKTFSKSVVVTIPVGVELTEYDLGVFAIDASGNEQKEFIKFHID
jgi:hypothetical protein